MIASRFGELEVIVHSPRGRPPRPVPLLFVHGAYTGAWCWEEFFLPWFAEQGFAAYAMSLSGHGRSRRKALLDNFALADYVRDVEQVVAALPASPVIVGHSMGGMVAQKFLERHPAAGIVLLASVPPQGLWSSTVEMMFRNPNLLADLNRLLSGGQPHVDSLREALFHQPIDEARLLSYYARCQPESHRAIWDMTIFNLPRPAAMHQAPMLVMGAENDRLIPAASVKNTARTYGLQAEIFPKMGHGMMLERDWEQVARRIRDWLEDTGLAA